MADANEASGQQQEEDSTMPFPERVALKFDQRNSKGCNFGGLPYEWQAYNSTLGGEKLGSLGHYESCNVFKMGSFSGGSTRRNRSSLRTKHPYRHCVKPQSSLESCLVAQLLYPNQTEVEGNDLSSLPFPTSPPTMRPLFVTDGSRKISRASDDFYGTERRTDDTKLHEEAYLEKEENVVGVPPLPEVGSSGFPMKRKFKSGKARFGRSSGSSESQDGSQNGGVVFCLGIAIGIVSSFIANRREVDKLKELLKQKENLVQDLQEELKMKDLLTVKEVANDSFGDRVPNPFNPEQYMDNSRKRDVKELYDEKAEENADSMSKIEAELEFELERMGLNMHTATVDRRLSGDVELDPDFVAVFAQGELRDDMANSQVVAQANADQDVTQPGNYAVSPRELSLRLHEVIQSRLEDHVKELEVALENSQRKVDSEHSNSWRKFSNSELNFPSLEESPITKEGCKFMAEPLVINMSGEALDTYNEAYEELMKINGSEEEDSPLVFYENNHQLGSHSFDRSGSRGLEYGINGSLAHLTCNEEIISMENYSSQGKTSEDHSLQELLCGVSGDENSDHGDDEMEQLIKKIVEKTKKGPPIVQNALKVLSLMDEKEQ